MKNISAILSYFCRDAHLVLFLHTERWPCMAYINYAEWDAHSKPLSKMFSTPNTFISAKYLNILLVDVIPLVQRARLILCKWSALFLSALTHWAKWRLYASINLTITGSDNGLSPGRRQVIIWINARTLLIGRLETNLNEISIEIYIFSFKKMHLKMSSGK